MKKIIYIIFYILLVIVLIFLGYLGWQRFFIKTDNQTSIATSTTPSKTNQPKKTSTNEDILQLINDNALAGYWIGDDGQVFLMKNTGEIEKIVGDKLQKITTQTINNINSVKPSPDNKKILVHFGYPNQSVFTIFNVDDESWLPLPKNTIAADWHPSNSEKIVYIENGSLKIFNLNNKKSKNVLKINLVDVLLDWQNDDEVLISDRPSSLIKTMAWKIDIKNKTLEETKGLAVVSKCASNQEKTYCAVPKKIPDNVVLPDDYLKKIFYTDDDFYIEDDLLYSNDKIAIDATSLTVSDNLLYFINRRDQKLYSLKLK